MNASAGSNAQVADSGQGWLLLITAVPSKPDYLRVKLRRRVQRLGAIGLKGAVYVLPESSEGIESFQWLRREILADGGDATVCLARLIDGMSDGDVIARFNQDRDAEYGEFIATCADLSARWSATTSGNDTGRPALVAERGRLFTRLEEMLGRDFFAAPAREDAMQAMERVAVLDITATNLPAQPDARGDFSGRTWATRAGVKVDRIASAWLIRRVIDPAAKFAFVQDGGSIPEGGVRFDMFDGEFTHVGNRCTFEVLLDHFGVTDPALRLVGQMVHDIDLHDDAYARPETAGLASMIEGIVRAVPGDDDRLRDGGRVLDLLAAGLAPGSS